MPTLCCHLRQDKGGVVEKEDPFMKLLEANRNRLTGKDMCLGKIAIFSGSENHWFGVFLFHMVPQDGVGKGHCLQNQLLIIMTYLLSVVTLQSLARSGRSDVTASRWMPPKKNIFYLKAGKLTRPLVLF